MSATIVLAAILVFGLIFLYVKKKKEAVIAAPLVPPSTTLEPGVQKTLDLIGQIDTAGETYEIKQRRQVVESRVAKRVLEISYNPVDNVQLMHDLNTIDTDVRKKGKTCLEQTIFESINTVIFGTPTHEEVEILEMIAAKAYLKMKGRALIVGWSYDDICGSTPAMSVPQGYREDLASEL